MGLKESSIGRKIGRIAYRTGLVGTAAAVAMACSPDKQANTPTLTLETLTPIAGKVLTPESTGEVGTDAEFVSKLFKEYLKLDTDPELEYLKNPENIDHVLRKKIGEIPTVREVPSGNFDPKEDAAYIVDGIWVSHKGNEATISFTVDENGHIVRSQKGEDMRAKIPWSTVEQGNLDTAKNLNRVVTHKPTDWKTIDAGANYEGSKAMESSVRLLPDGKKIKYQIFNNLPTNLPFVVIHIH